jgi:hypothetical protein
MPANWIPEVYSDLLLMERDREAVFIPLCNRDYTEKGTAKDIQAMGDRVHFTALPDPTIREYTKGQTLTGESMKDATVEMEIDKAYYFDVEFEDVDKRQGMKDIAPDVAKKARKGFVKTADQYIGGLYGQCYTTVTQTAFTSANVISTISSAATYLYKNDVPYDEEVELVVSPDILEKIQMADILFNTDNSKTLNTGWLGMMKKFINMRTFVSNNVTISGTTSYCMMFTKEAIAFAEQIPGKSIEKLRSTTKLADIIRGLHLYGAKVIKPKELICLALTPTAETVV